jgi:hypothetical protein
MDPPRLRARIHPAALKNWKRGAAVGVGIAFMVQKVLLLSGARVMQTFKPSQRRSLAHDYGVLAAHRDKVRGVICPAGAGRLYAFPISTSTAIGGGIGRARFGWLSAAVPSTGRIQVAAELQLVILLQEVLLHQSTRTRSLVNVPKAFLQSSHEGVIRAEMQTKCDSARRGCRSR